MTLSTRRPVTASSLLHPDLLALTAPTGSPWEALLSPLQPKADVGAYLGHTLLSQAAVIRLWGSSTTG